MLHPSWTFFRPQPKRVLRNSMENLPCGFFGRISMQ